MTEKFNRVPLFTHQIVKYFGFFMVVFYLVIGLLFIFSTQFFPALNQNAKLFFGIILLIYGIFRAYRAIKSLKHDNPA
ncbi:MAG: hypothetical protein M0Q51_06000 [Bacteroidales bacterium]|nr:hypothetical protein [Bacteroidales bacterium]